MSLDSERRRINRELIAGRITDEQAQRQTQNLYSREPVLASTLFDPGSPRPGYFVPFDEETLRDTRHGAQQPQRRMKW